MSTATEPSSSTASDSPSKERIEVMSKAVNLMGQGKRNLICGDLLVAVSQFEESCQILAESYGEMAFECAAAYFSYGHALLELARLDTKVIDNLEAEAEENEEEEGDDDDDDDDDEEESEKSDKSDKDADKDSEAKSKDEGTEDEDRTDKSESLSSQDEGTEAKEKPEKEVGENEDEHNAGNDVTNLQLAWESLELAKIIYLKREEKDSQLKAAQAYLKLGEVGLETGLYDQAVDDIKECLKIQKHHLEAEEREIAETYYQLGLVHVFANSHDAAIENFKEAVSVIESRIGKLNKTIEPLKDSKEKDDVETVYNAKTEIKELDEIVPDIKQKITDTVEEKKTVADLKVMAKKEAAEKMMAERARAGSSSGFETSSGFGTTSLGFGTTSSGFGSDISSSSKGSGDAVGSTTTTTGFGSILSADSKTKEAVKTTDISHLVRRKRKPENTEESLEKRQKGETGGSVDTTSSSKAQQQKDSNNGPLSSTNKEDGTEGEVKSSTTEGEVKSSTTGETKSSTTETS